MVLERLTGRKHVNFVSGKNGSGKSAILQAIQLCFGMKAHDTGRGRNLKGFIKTVSCSDSVMFSGFFDARAKTMQRSLCQFGIRDLKLFVEMSTDE